MESPCRAGGAQALGRGFGGEDFAQHVAVPRRGGEDQPDVGQGLGRGVEQPRAASMMSPAPDARTWARSLGQPHWGAIRRRSREAEILHRPGGGADIFPHLGVAEDHGGGGHLRL